MAVTFTSNIGLAKPDETEVAKNWVTNTKLCEDNNLIIQDKTDVNLVGYTPTLIAATTNPSFGAGFIQGEYQEIQGYVFGRFRVIFLTPGVTVGSGEYGISLPFVADATYHNVATSLAGFVGTCSCIGEGYIRDETSLSNSGSIALDLATITGVSYVRLVTETHTGKTSRVFRDSMPFAVATDDSFSGNFIYKKA